MSDITRHHVDLFLGLMDEILNAVLLSLEIIFLSLSWQLFGLSVADQSDGVASESPIGSWKVLTWGVLCRGIPVALALSISAGTARVSSLR